MTSLLKSFSRLARKTHFLSNYNQKETLLNPFEYWSGYNVTGHKDFVDHEESINYLHWRNCQYYNYEELMPVNKVNNLCVLDYGCGPGNDLVGFLEYGKPRKLIGADISSASLREAKNRLNLHSDDVQLMLLEDDGSIPLENESIDYIHCSGVLHHCVNPEGVLTEFRRILAGSGTIKIMVYNYYSIWMHLYAAYIVRFTHPGNESCNVYDLFRKNTDTDACPISNAWTQKEFIAMCEKAGFKCKHLGNATSVKEMEILHHRFQAILEPRLEKEHREFLSRLEFDCRGVPMFEKQYAGIDACYELGKS